MIFGPVPPQDAVGTILAHSVRTGRGRLRKGHVLSEEDCQSLAKAGLTEVIVARPEPDDVSEDDAASALANALWQEHPGLRRTHAFTGRVNLLAKGPGVVRLDVSALEAANAVDPMITVATVPPFKQMAEGGMVATVKIISYAVRKDKLAEACARAKGAVGYARPELEKATLIITEIPGGAGEKGRDAIAGRLNALGVTLEDVVTVPHEKGALTQAVSNCKSPLILILTGSATSDIADVAPSAVVAAGGRIERFGMPVDPGNLLFLGSKDTQQVIGLPGCARSPALNGADWVLSRVVCGVPVNDADIAGMGVGGLLKEIPTRPQPRNRPPKSASE